MKDHMKHRPVMESLWDFGRSFDKEAGALYSVFHGYFACSYDSRNQSTLNMSSTTWPRVCNPILYSFLDVDQNIEKGTRKLLSRIL